MKKYTYITAGFLIILLVFGSFAAGFLYSAKIHQNVATTSSNSKDFDFDLLKEAITNIRQTYYETPSNKKMLDGAISGIMESLDNPYASYYPPVDYKHFRTSMNGNYSGIGIVIGGKKGQIKVLKVFEDSPAAENKLKEGDQITSINSKKTVKMDVDQAADLIKGPEGTTVKLSLFNDHKERNVTITRRQISFPNVSSKIYDNIGYLRMHMFSEGVSEDLAKEIKKFQKKGLKKLILDLRGNPGGELNEAINVSSLFIDKGVIVRTKDKNKKETVYSATGGQLWDGDIVVLINQDTASSSEIVSGAVQDRHRGKVVGVRSFGKGTVQQVVTMSNNAGLIIPSEYWLTPNGRSITKKGIKPDYHVKDDSIKVDKQLEKAKSLLK